MLSFVGKQFLPKRCLFVLCIFYLNEKELNQQVCLIKYVENEISNSTSPKKKKERERETDIQTDRQTDRQKNKDIMQKHFKNHKNVSKTPEKFYVVTLVTNYHKLSLLPLVVRP